MDGGFCSNEMYDKKNKCQTWTVTQHTICLNYAHTCTCATCVKHLHSPTPT